MSCLRCGVDDTDEVARLELPRTGAVRLLELCHPCCAELMLDASGRCDGCSSVLPDGETCCPGCRQDLRDGPIDLHVREAP